ncbi:cytochrome P450 2K1-like [Mantella aurantiaca]
MLITMDFSVITYVVLALTILYVFNNLWKWNKGNIKNFPPGPRGLPFIGNVHIMDLKKPHFTYLELAKKYGPVFSVQMGSKQIVVLAGYETVKDALVNYAEEFGGRGKTRIFQNMDKEFGVIHSRGENWKVMRRFTLTTLRDFGMGKSPIEEKIIEECSYLIKSFGSLKGKPFDNIIMINSAVANVIVSVLLGHRMDYEDRQFKRLLSLTSENIRLLGSRMVGIYNIFPSLGFLPGSHKTIIKNVEEMCEYVTQTFIKHLKNLNENDQRSFIDAFLVRQKEEAGNPNSYFHNENLTRLVRNLFVAGMETTSTTLRWGLLLMMKFPAIQEKVQEEITKVIGLAQPMYSHRVQMPYTNAVIHEIQRFADIVPLSVPHETTRDVTFKGYFIPKETYVIPLLSSVLRDKTQFEKPDEFYPNHFLNSHGNFIKKDAFMPFSAGRRACAGENLARMELFIFFANMLQKFTFSFPPGVNESDLLPGVGFTNLPKQYLMCAVRRY